MLTLFLILAVQPAVLVALLCSKKTRKPVLRWLSGAPLDGKIHTDATFFRHPTKVKHPRGRVVPHKWHWRPGWHRSVVRAGIPVLAELILAGLLLATMASLITIASLAALALTWAAWKVYRKVHRWWPSTSR